jgi:hypothetical protein
MWPGCKVTVNERAEIKADTRIKTDTKVQNNRPDLFIPEKGATRSL